MARLNTRIPVIALDYVNERHKAVEKELLVDYDSGNIYVVSKDDKSIIIDITGKIKEQLENMTGDKIEITIEGIGTVNLTEIIKKLQLDIANSVQVTTTGEDIHYVGRENVLDEKSIEVVNKKIQLKGFSSAEPHMIPRKGSNGELEWINMLLVPDDNGGTNGGGSAGDVIPPGNPDDGESLFVTVLEPINDKIYLRASRRQKSVGITRNCMVVIPRVLDQFCEIEWYVVTSEIAPLFKFSNNVLWANIADTQPRVKSHHVYKFKTWDAGETWVGEIVHYSRTANDPIGTVDMEYLKENYLDKTQITDDYYNKSQVDEMIDDINTFDSSNFYNKEEIRERYYDKTQVNNIMEASDTNTDEKLYLLSQDINQEIERIENIIPDVSNMVEREELDNYYNKEEIDERFNNIDIPSGGGEGVVPDLTDYVKQEYLSENYYNKEAVETMVEGVHNEIPDVSNMIGREELDNYYNKEEIDERFESIPPVNADGTVDLSNYYNKQQMEEKYYDKIQIDDRINDLNTVDPVNYYNKEEIDTKLDQEYYNKEHIDSEHYNRQEVDELVSWKEGTAFQNKLPKYRK